MGPVLYVGDVALLDSERLGDRVYRFYGYDVDQLEEGEPISIAWLGREDLRVETDFAFVVDSRAIEK
jgi:hypothetical protein